MQDRSITTPQGTDLFALGQERMQWLQTRQSTLAGNIANSDTPGYTARDVSPFQGMVDAFDITPRATQAGHFGATEEAGHAVEIENESSIDGNHVSLDRQMEQVADTNDQQHMAASIYGKYMSMFQTVLGK